MGDRSAIEWTDATWNPVTGCSKVSPGCAHCYAATLAPRLARMGQSGYTELPWTPENAAANVFLHPDRLAMPLRWTRPRRIFVNSMSDLFHEQVPDAFVDRVFAAMAVAYRHTYQVLTKRPDRMRAYLSDPETPTRVGEATRSFTRPGRGPEASFAYHVFDQAHSEEQWRRHGSYSAPGYTWRVAWPLPTVWVGTSVENQTWAGRRIPDLLDSPAGVRFLSCEPLLGPLDLRPWLIGGIGSQPGMCTTCGGTGVVGFGLATRRCPVLCRRDWVPLDPRLHWVIAGGESGPGHRPVDPAWVRALRDQCVEAGVPLFFKQWGGRRAGGEALLDGREHKEFPDA